MTTPWTHRINRLLLALFGPADVEHHPAPAPPVGTRAELIPGGWERRGSPGHYYIVRVETGHDGTSPG